MNPLGNVSEMLQRNLSLFDGKRLLVCGLLEDDLPLLLRQHVASLEVFTTDYCYYRQYQERLPGQLQFGHQYQIVCKPTSKPTSKQTIAAPPYESPPASCQSRCASSP